MKWIVSKERHVVVAAVVLGGALLVAGVAWGQVTSSQRSAEEPIVLIDRTWTDSGIRGHGEAIHRCPPNQVMTGVRGVDYDDRDAVPGVECALPVIGEHANANAATIGAVSDSGWLEPVTDEWVGHACGGSDLVPMVASVHEEGRFPRLQVRCAAFVADSKADRSFPGGPLEVRTVRSEKVETLTERGRFTVRCPENTAITERSELHGGDGSKPFPYPGVVKFTCTAWKVVAK